MIGRICWNDLHAVLCSRGPSFGRIVILALFIGFSSIAGSAATFTVTKIADTNDGVCDVDCSLKEAVAAANAAGTSDVVNFDPAVFNVPRIISLGTTSLTITNNGTLAINGPGKDLLTIDCNINTAIVTNSNTITSLNDFTVTGSLTGTSGRIFNGLNGSMSLNRLVVRNSGEAFPGAWNTGQMSVNDCSFINNKGNALYNDHGTMTVFNSSLTNNWGGIGNDRGNLSVASTSISNNSGAGIFNTSGPVTLDQVVISGNTRASGFGNDGGGISSFSDVFPGPLFTITNSTISGNQVSGENSDGGGISNVGSTVMNISNSSITGNKSLHAHGGGINALGVVSLTNTTVAGNSAGLDGGGIFTGNAPNLSHVTVSQNLAGRSGGGIRGEATMKASIVGDNIATNGPDVSGNVSSLGFNLIENVSNATIGGTLTGNILGKDPQLVSLRDNGGGSLTISLQPTSPAIDAADPASFPPSDQRNIPRAQDGDLNGLHLPDIGSYERQVTSLIVTKTPDTNDGVCDADCSLREALAVANAAATPDIGIIFDPAVFSTNQVITLALGELLVSTSRTLIIQGPGAGLLTVSGNSASRVLFIATGANAAVSDVKISGGNGIGAAFLEWGGGIFSRQAVFAIRNSLLTGNSVSNSSGVGGGVYNFRGTLRILRSTVTDNSAWTGGGVFSSDFGGVLNLEFSTVSNNTAGGTAGVFNQGAATIEDSDIVGNTASVNCGGLNAGETVLISRSRIRLNNGGIRGGGICGPNTGTITDSVIERNIAAFGAGIAGGSTLAIVKTAIMDNVASAHGGGLETGTGTITIAQSTIAGNRADIGGGIFCTGTLTITNSTISRNSAAGSFGGGGIFSEINSGALSLSNTTIAFNSAQSGGGVQNNFGAVNVRNTILANNTASVSGPDFNGTLTSQGYNLIKNLAGTIVAGTTTGNITNQDPLLDAVLRSHGGPTRTHLLRLGSPAIDRGSATTPATTIDQRGLPRPIDFPTRPNAPGGNASDIGAVERQLNDVTYTPFDFDGDGKADVGIFRPSVAEWWIYRSLTGTVFAAQFGATTDKIVPADYTGDGKTDVAFWRPVTGEWFVIRSEDSTYYSGPFGSAGDIPAPADYDADGKADVAVFRPSTGSWFIQRSSDGAVTSAQFGGSGDVPVVGDFDGDGRADLSIYHASAGEWWLNRTTEGLIVYQFGNSTDKQVPGDYTGDGKTDVAFWRPVTGEWFVIRSEDTSYFSAPFGADGDIPAPGDYDGDGKFDLTVFRPSSGNWFVNRSSGGTTAQQFGADGDVPLPTAFLR